MKWVFRLLGLIFVLVLVLGVFVLFLPADRVARIAVDQLSAATGRDVSISGVSLTIWPVLGVRADGLEVGNASWAEQGAMLQAENAAIGVDAASLLRGEINITHIEAQSPTIRLEQRLDGRASWRFSDSSGEAAIETSTSPDRTPRPVSVKKLSVRDATLIYDAEGSDLVSYQGVDLTVDWPDRLGPAQIEARLVPSDVVVEGAATVDGFAGFLAGEIRGLSAQLSSEAGTLSFEGRASTAGEVDGRFTFAAQDTGAFLRSLGLPAAQLPPKLGQSVDVQANLTLTADRRLALRDLVADLGGNRLTGDVDASLNGTPEIVAKLDAGALDVSQAAGSTNGGSGSETNGSPSRSGWSRDPIDASGLSAFNGDIELTASSVDLGQFQLGATRAVLKNENARMVFELRDIEAYGGRLNGEFVINNRNGLSVGGRMAAKAIQMQPLLRDAIDLDRLTGQAELSLSFLGVGASVHEIMNSLSGDGAMSVGRGTIEGIDLDGLLRGDVSGSGTTIFDDLSATWTIAQGNLNNNDLLFQLKNYQASGAGRVGLGVRDIDYTFTPVALRANNGQGLSVPVRFRGPWSDISIRPDLEAALELELDAEKDALEQKARDKINDALGVSEEDDRSTEDQIKDRLLRKLFD